MKISPRYSVSRPTGGQPAASRPRGDPPIFTAICYLLALVLVPAALLLVDPVHGQVPAGEPAGARFQPTSIDLPPFLEQFLHAHKIHVELKQVQWESALGRQAGLLAHPNMPGPLPALLLISGDPDSKAFLQKTAGELAGIGYVVLVPPLGGDNSIWNNAAARERWLTPRAAAVRWLRSRQEVDPDRVGAWGWSQGGLGALILAGTQSLQAGVLCDVTPPVALDRGTARQIQQMPMLWIRAGKGQFLDGERLAALRSSFGDEPIDLTVRTFDDVGRGFLDASRAGAFRHETTDQAWFEIYEFLGKHVEDAHIKPLHASRQTDQAGPGEPVYGTIADMMRAVNVPTGVRGQLAKSLAGQPENLKAWQQVHARAALLVEVSSWLARCPPPKGSTVRWIEHNRAYRAAAMAVARAADHQDIVAARNALRMLNGTCGKCHLDHR